MLVLGRAAAYAALFIGLVLVFLPAQVLSWSGVTPPPPAARGLPQGAGVLMGAVGGALALWCVATLALVGKGTPAPFDPPRRLVMQGPYRVVRNPMYLGAALALAGAALYYESGPLAGYTALFLLATHLFVVWYEEPALRRTFGPEYEFYCGRVRRWWPGLHRVGSTSRTLVLCTLLIACHRPTEVRGLYISQDGSGMLFPCNDPTIRLVVQDSALEARYVSMGAAHEPLFVALRGIKTRSGSPKGGGQWHFQVREILESRARADGECPGAAQPMTHGGALTP